MSLFNISLNHSIASASKSLQLIKLTAYKTIRTLKSFGIIVLIVCKGCYF